MICQSNDVYTATSDKEHWARKHGNCKRFSAFKLVSVLTLKPLIANHKTTIFNAQVIEHQLWCLIIIAVMLCIIIAVMLCM